MLVAFMGYIGLRYQALVGRDCSCFPWLKRTVTPALFVEDGAMLAAALIAAWFSRKAVQPALPDHCVGGDFGIGGRGSRL